MGGVYARAFAARHLDRVAGMVLVDSSHEGQWAVLPAHYSLKNRMLASLFVPQLVLFSRRACARRRGPAVNGAGSTGRLSG